MSYTAAYVIPLDTAGLTLSAQLVDTAGVNVGSAVTTGFVDLAGGFYGWAYGGFPDGFRGYVKVLNGATVLAAVAVNPEDGENLDTKVSLVKAQTDQIVFTGGDVRARLSTAGVQAVWDALTSALTTAGSVGKRIADFLDVAVSSIDPTAPPGPGGVEHVHTATDLDARPMDGVSVWVTTGTNPATGVVASGITDTLGQVTFMLEPGTYQLWQQLAGENFNNPTAITVS
jgi:hypothetical protein